AMAKRLKDDLARDGVPRDEVERRVEGSIRRFTQSPALILVCLTMEGMDAYPDAPRRRAEHIMAVQSVAASIENLLIALHSLGLGACWCCAPLFSQPEVRAALGIPEDVEPQALITVGWSDERPVPPPRLPLERVVHGDGW
ncbi:TPA: nitroreductase family protein, partial [Candidatus Bathyarchaeota archaeon]|nr:nitroreductase family protein [Candidatus Bathyarchaeota archaeon]